MITDVRAAGAVRRPTAACGHLAVLGLVAALPAVLASGVLLAWRCTPLGRWSPLVLAGWLAVVPALHTRAGEREAVAVGCRFRTLARVERAALGPVWLAACCAAGIAVADVDLYLKCEAGINAYAAGRRSVAVTSGALTTFLAGSLPPLQMKALLLHELGHHVTGGVRYGLVMAWLAWPWRVARHLVLGLCCRQVFRRQPRGVLALVVASGVVVAVAQSVQQRHLVVAVVLAVVAVCTVVCPVFVAWASRRAEFAADRFAVSCGAGPALAVLLSGLETHAGARCSTLWVLRRHPPLDRRVARLARVRVGVPEPTKRPHWDDGGRWASEECGPA